MTERRGPGEGSIRERANGTYEGRVTIAGKRVSVYGKTKTETRRLMRKELDRAERGEVRPDGRMTVDRFLDAWCASYGEDTPLTTRDSYYRIVTNHLRPGLGKHRVKALTREHVRAFLTGLRESGTAATTVDNIRGVLAIAFKWGINTGIVASNPASGIRISKKKKTEAVILSIDQARHLVQVSWDDPYHSMYSVLLDTQIRLGELLGLRWVDVDRKAHTLTVAQQIVPVAGKLLTKAPKSDSSRRQIVYTDVTDHVLTMREAWEAKAREQAGETWIQTGLVFCGATGETYPRGSFHRNFHAFFAAHDLPRSKPHDLRHTGATRLLAVGVNLKEVSERLGHSSVRTTADIYTATTDESRKATAAAMQSILIP